MTQDAPGIAQPARITRYVFTLEGVVKPYVRMTQRGKWVDAQAQQYLASKAAIQVQLQTQMSHNDWNVLSGRIPIGFRMRVQRSSALHRCDLDNIIKAVLDAAQGVVFMNDCWIDSIFARRYIGPTDVVQFSVYQLVVSQLTRKETR